MNAKQCDRCHKFYTGNRAIVEVNKRTYINRPVVIPTGSVTDRIAFDLCQDCMVEFGKFMGLNEETDVKIYIPEEQK